MEPQNLQMQELYQELEDFEGSRVSPMQVVAAYMVKEQGCYMRDYVLDPSGNIEELSFHNITEE